jgi:hypothetical protein
LEDKKMQTRLEDNWVCPARFVFSVCEQGWNGFKNKKAEGASQPTLSERGAGTQSRMKLVKTSALKFIFFHFLNGIPF